MEVPVRVWRVGRDEESHYLLVLRDEVGTLLMMTIGPCEAVSIWSALSRNGSSTRKLEPMAHDLLCDLLSSLGGKVTKVVVDDFWNDVYFAKLHLAVDSSLLTVDSRPSDAVAIALRVGAPLFVTDNVLEAASRGDSAQEQAPEEPGGDSWGDTQEP